MAFLTRIGLDASVTSAQYPTTLNGVILNNETRDQSVGRGHWTMGFDLERIEGGTDYRFTTWTVENSMHVTNFRCTITPEGKLISGRVNCFGLGWMDLDQGYVDELVQECEDQQPKWVDIVRE